VLNKTLTIATLFVASSAIAEDVPITGEVQSKCSIYTTTQGVFGAPSINELSTKGADGGVNPILRVDTSQAGYYLAKITTPSSFSTSPSLTDSVTWTGDVSVSQVSDPLMSDYDTTKTSYNETHEYDLTVAGSTWFEVESTVTYGVDKSLPGGTYVAMVTAECIAK
jgi:hypothetical protein